ncbi:MAG: pitrilysin family protein, partial [Bacteroidota bacterium]
MKAFKISIFVVLLLSRSLFAQIDRSQAPEAGPAPKIQIGEYESFSLDNGLKVFVVENHKIPRVSFNLTLDIDPILEKDKAGYIGVAGQMLRRGTTNRSKAQLDQEIDFIGANIGTGSTNIFASSLKKHTEKLLELMSDVLYNPSFPQEEMDKIIKQTMSGLKQAKESPDAISNNLKSALRYGTNHPYGEIQTEETTQNITLADCKKYYETYFKPNVAYLVIVGDINVKTAKPLVEKYFAKWERGEVPRQEYEVPNAPAKTEVAIADKTGAVQTVLAITYPIELKLGDEDFFQAMVMNQILGGSFGARLSQNLREDKGYTYGSYSSLSQNRLVGSFNAGASVRNEVSDSATTQFLYELNRIRDKQVDSQELTRAKNLMTGSFARSLESPQRIASFALNTARYNLPADYYETYLEKLNAVTEEEVQAVAKKYIRPENAYIIGVGDKEVLAEKLAQFGKVTEYDNYGNEVTAEAKAAASNIDVDEVINKYLKAIGGEAKLRKIKTIKTEGSMELMGMSITISTAKQMEGPLKGKSFVSQTMNGNEMMRVVYDGEQAASSGMMGSKKFEGDDTEPFKYDVAIFRELDYKDKGFKVEAKEM